MEPEPGREFEQCKIIVCDLKGAGRIKFENGIILIDYKYIDP